jgi:hypothetical protein
MLAMSGEVAKAKSVWQHARDLDLAFQERNSVSFRPRLPNDQEWMKGRVVKLGAGFAFLAVVGLPDFFCAARQYSGHVLHIGDSVEFKPGFSARGPVVVDLNPAP